MSRLEQIEVAPFASAARTATTNSGELLNDTGKGVVLNIDVTAASATPSVVFKIQGLVNGNYNDILTSAAITGTGQTTWKVYPGITAAANVAVSDVLPRKWRLLATHADADSITYSVAGYLIP